MNVVVPAQLSHTSLRPPVLVIAAHPDDETLGCGGTIARTVRERVPVDVVVVTQTGPYLDRYQNVSGDLDARRQSEAHAACEVLGVRDLFFGDFEETHLAARPFPALVEFLRHMIERVNPAVILTHSDSDLHQDHRAIHEATCIAARAHLRTATPNLRRVLAYSSDVTHHVGANIYVDITATLRAKLDALRCYTSELRDYPHPRSTLATKFRARSTGVLASMTAAEAFSLVWEVI